MGSPAPYGYRYSNGELVIVEAEAEVVRRIFELYQAGNSMGDIASSLTNASIPTKTKAQWSRQTISRILHNPLYAGYLRWNDKVYKSDMPPIVTEATYCAVNGEIH